MPNRSSSPAPGGAFPLTRHSVLHAVAGSDAEARQRAYGRLVEGYWKPVYKYLRVRWRRSAEDAADLTQEFFLKALEKRFFAGFDPRKARFRTYLRTCLDRFVANQRRAEKRQKRGGESRPLSLDFAGADGELRETAVPDPLDVEEYFHREWLRGFFQLVVEELRRRAEAQGKAVHFRLFERYDLEGAEPGERLTYADLARETGLPVTQVTNHLAWARRELRALALERLRELTGSEAEFRAEARLLFGVDR